MMVMLREAIWDVGDVDDGDDGDGGSEREWVVCDAATSLFGLT